MCFLGHDLSNLKQINKHVKWETAKEKNRTDLLPLDESIYFKEKIKLTSVYKKRLLLRFTQTPPASPPPPPPPPPPPKKKIYINKQLLTKKPVNEGTGWTSRITDVLDAPGAQGTEEDQGRDGRKTWGLFTWRWGNPDRWGNRWMSNVQRRTFNGWNWRERRD